VHTTGDGAALSASTTALSTGELSSGKNVDRDSSISEPQRRNAEAMRSLESKAGKDHSSKAPRARTESNKSQTKAGRKQ